MAVLTMKRKLEKISDVELKAIAKKKKRLSRNIERILLHRKNTKGKNEEK